MPTRLFVSESKIVSHRSILLGRKGDDEFRVDIPDGKKLTKIRIYDIHGRYNKGLRITLKPQAGETGSNKKIKVHYWFDGGGSPFSDHDNPYITYTIKVEARDVPKRAILVACENTGYLQSLDNLLPNELKNAARRVIDFTAEIFEEANAHTLFDEPYDKVVCLIDTQCTKKKIKEKIIALGKSYILDMAILGHGSVKNGDAYLVLHGDELLRENDVRQWSGAIEFQKLKLGLVYMTNCKGSKFNDTWRKLGFKTSIGSVNNNYMPEPMFTTFWAEWTKGITAIEASKRSYSTAQSIWQVVYPPTIKMVRTQSYPFIELHATTNKKIKDSKPVVAGSRNFQVTSTI